jgi:RpiR family transcriptional regulator, carbohydrate utilization regulator
MENEGSASEGVIRSLKEIFTSLGPQQQAVARVILENVGELAFLSAGQVAQRAGTHAATVVRLAQRLGYDGFPDLQDELRRQSPQYPAFLDMADRVVQSGTLEDIVVKSFAQAGRNLERASHALNLEAVREMVKSILVCRRVLVLGLGVARPVGAYLASSLRYVGADVHEAGDSVTIAQEVALLGTDDVLFAIDYQRYYRESAHFASEARQNGATVLALTDSVTSTLAPFAHHVVAVPSEAAATPRTSLAASMVVIEVLLASITTEAGDRTKETMGRIDRQYKHAKIFDHTRNGSTPK